MATAEGDPPDWLLDLRDAYGELDTVVHELPSAAALDAVVRRGWRRQDLAETLEEQAGDRRIPAGDVDSFFRLADTTRARILLARLHLGVGPLDHTRVESLIATLDDAVVRAVLRAHLDDHADGTTERLCALLDHPPSSERRPQHDVLVLIGLAAAWPRVRKRATRIIRANSLERALARRDSWTSVRRMPAIAPIVVESYVGFVLERARPMTPLANVAPPTRNVAVLRESESTVVSLDALERELARGGMQRTRHVGIPRSSLHASFRALGPTLERPSLERMAAWPTLARLWCLDGLADADGLSLDAIAFLEERARAWIRLAPVSTEERLALGARAETELEPRDVREATVAALVTHAPGRVLRYAAELASALEPAIRTHAASVLRWTSGTEGMALLDVLACDPSASVRASARTARSDLADIHDAREWLRTVAWIALRDDEASELIADAMQRTRCPPLRLYLLRRIQRFLSRYELSERAERRVLALLGEAPATAVAEGELLPSATLTATDGRAIDVTVERTRGGRSSAFGAIVDGVGGRTESLAHAFAFLGACPSRFMRMSIDGEPDRAVELRLSLGSAVIVLADPNLLRAL